MKYKNISIVGGAGFLGYHTSLELVRRGCNVTVLALPDETVDNSLAGAVAVKRADIDELSDQQLGDIPQGHDALIYAAGPDDRVELSPGVKASDFFSTQLVERTRRVLQTAKNIGISKAIIFGSYFSYINNHAVCGVKKGSLERHPYVKARVEQTKQAFYLGDDNFSVAILNIPYVFGVAPGKEPIWREVFIERFGQMSKIYYGSGGTTVISANKIAYGAAQALELAEHGSELAIGSNDMKFKPMIEQLLKSANIKKPVGNIPAWLQALFMRKEWQKMQSSNLDSGLDMRYLVKDILSKNFFIDHKSTDNILQMPEYQDDVDQAIIETGQKISLQTNET